LWAQLNQPRPQQGDPVGLLPADRPALSVRRRLQLLEDPRTDVVGGGCRALAQLPVGRTELLFRPCPTLQLGWHLEVEGRLQRPRPAIHPLLAGPAERLQRQGVWTQLRVRRWRLLQRPATPIADLRRRMAAAILGTRVMRDRRLRLLTMLIIPFSLCSARLNVSLFMAAVFFPPRLGGLVIFGLYGMSFLAALLTALLFRGRFESNEPLVLELPPTGYQPWARSLVAPGQRCAISGCGRADSSSLGWWRCGCSTTSPSAWSPPPTSPWRDALGA